MRTRHQEMTIGQLKHVVTIADGSPPKVHLEALVAVGIGHHGNIVNRSSMDVSPMIAKPPSWVTAVVRVRIGVIKQGGS